jgi:hypothetical protein
MRDYSLGFCYTKKDHHDVFYTLKVNLKFEIFKYLSNFYSNFQIKMIWGFLVFFKKNFKTNSYSIYDKKIKKIISNVKNIRFDSENILALSEMFFFLKTQKKKNPFSFNPNPFYIEFQYDINRKMRAILVDWLIDVHCKFKLVPATLYLTINSIDRFLSLHILMRQKLQLLGISSMLLASKYEEIYAPETRDFVYISDNAYSKDDIFKMEILICTTLEYVFHIKSPIFFISDWSKILNASREEMIFSVYSFELHLVEYDSLVFQNDIIFVGSLLNAVFLLNNLNLEVGVIDFFEKINKPSLNFQVLNEILMLTKSLLILNQNGKRKLTSLKRKYNHKKYKEVSELTFLFFFKCN